ncbi:anti-sigma factor family protein [Acidobacteriota bacterium]
MRKCNYDSLIDDYLLNRLNKSDRERFEDHYFNCPPCFAEMEARDEMISVIKDRGQSLFTDIEEPVINRRPSLLEGIFSFFTPKQWAVAAVSTVLLIVLAVGITPSFKTKSPQFFINEDLVRGESIQLISPVINVDNVPEEFTWKSLGKDAEYRIYIFNSQPIWDAATRDTSISLPEQVKVKMVPGHKYTWQVKAFSNTGTLISVSSKVQFEISQ